MKRYNPKEIEPKWQQQWVENKTYEVTEQSEKPKSYILDFFPYPSGSAMHVGHVRNYTISDVIARHKRMTGHNVLHPMAWDAFGLPAENYAIKTGISPADAVAQNTGKFKQQLMQLGVGVDWSRMFSSSDPTYYRWTQWFFKLLFDRGLAYQKESLQWWCETDKTVLANEQVEAGKCWRCGNQVIKKPLKQWFFKITDYADRLEADLDNVNWTDSIKAMQRNWIGRSKGAEVDFKIADSDQMLKVFTTRADTLFGATFMVLAPEHKLVQTITTSDQRHAVDTYITQTLAKSDIERQETDREKTGVFTGAYAINPVNGQKISIWIADYVLVGYGTGAIMAVPAHDERDHEFAKKFNLQIIEVITPPKHADTTECYHGEGVMKNSDGYDGLPSDEMREKIVADLAEKGIATEQINYKLRDWLISRQRYWGAPIPIVHCEKCGAVPVPEDQLPVELPPMQSYEPSGDGRSPLARMPDWVNTTCPNCDGHATRETDTMDGFACSSWYFLRFADPHNNTAPFDKAKVDYWLPVDTYVGGAEHALMHLLYARMWTKVMFDAGMIDFEEPFTTLRNHGMILAEDGQKISKSQNNGPAPDQLIADGYGADSIRVMELFIAPWNQAANWSTTGLGGCYRFLTRFWTIAQEVAENQGQTGENASDAELKRVVHKTIKKVSADLHELGFNTAIAALMEAVNDLYKLRAAGTQGETWTWAIKTLTQLLAPFAPYITEELWQQFGGEGSVHHSQWPMWDDAVLVQDEIKIVVQVNGKVRATVEVAKDAAQADVEKVAFAHEHVAQFVGENTPKRIVYVPGRLLNIVV